MKSLITISRYWNNPKITTSVSSEGIALQVEMASFLEALVRELGPVTWVFRDKTFRERLDKAVITVTEKIKEESIKVI